MDERLKRAILELVLDALWEFPMFVMDDDGETRLDEDTVQEWSGKVDDLWQRAETGKWQPEEM